MSGALSQDNVNEWENEWRAVSRQCVYPVSSVYVSYRARRRHARAPWALYRWSQLDRAGARTIPPKKVVT